VGRDGEQGMGQEVHARCEIRRFSSDSEPTYFDTSKAWLWGQVKFLSRSAWMSKSSFAVLHCG